MKVLFLVNGSEASAAGHRARAFAERMPEDWQTALAYRPERKWKGILPFLHLAQTFRPQVLYVMDTAYTGVLAGVLAKRLIGCALITDTGDVAYELALSSGVYSSRQLALIRWIENLALTRSDHIVVRGSYHKQLLQEQGISHVTFIPDGVDVAQIPVLDAADLRKHLGLSDTLVVGMVGTMLWSVRHRMCYGWDIIEALALLPDMPVKALLVGDGDGKPILEQRAQELGVAHRVVFTGKLPYADLPGYLYAMDVCVSTQSNDRIGMVRTTGKLPLYLACNRYVVATDVGEARRVLPGVGGLLPYHGVRDDAHPQRLADHLRYLLAHPERLESALQGREIARTHFDYPLLAQKVQALCQEVRVQTRPSLLAKDFPGRN